MTILISLCSLLSSAQLYAQSPPAGLKPSPSPEFSSDDELFIPQGRPVRLIPSPPCQQQRPATCPPVIPLQQVQAVPHFVNNEFSSDEEPPPCPSQPASRPVSQLHPCVHRVRCQWVRAVAVLCIRVCQCGYLNLASMLKTMGTTSIKAIDRLWNLLPLSKAGVLPEEGIYIDQIQQMPAATAFKYQNIHGLVLDAGAMEYLLNVMEDLSFTLAELDASYPQLQEFLTRYNSHWSFEENIGYWLRRKDITRFHFHNFYHTEELLELTDTPAALLSMASPQLIILVVNSGGFSTVVNIQSGETFITTADSELSTFLNETFPDNTIGSILLPDEDYESSSESGNETASDVEDKTDTHPRNSDSEYDADSEE